MTGTAPWTDKSENGSSGWCIHGDDEGVRMDRCGVRFDRWGGNRGMGEINNTYRVLPTESVNNHSV